MDLQAIWSTLSADSISAADRVIDALVQRFELLAEFPEMGKERPELAAALRSFPVGNYLVFYRITPEVIEVVRVLHAARDLPTHFRAADHEPGE